ncbi:hypothetical protein MVEN_02348800 [Mycena venus]|uniref:Uncharacterized protein n=1 Tax=Mycena venus TaxID=2733690 RepID=A0A8H6X386_9AGAR|nr:hypothetical protein MVEN_02348800 [Mycena venus]
MVYTVDSKAFDSSWNLLVIIASQTMASLFFYGVYVSLFLLSLYTLSRRKTAGAKLLITASCLMAIVGSTQMALDLAMTVEAARLHQEVVHTPVSNEHGLIMLPLLMTLPVLGTARNLTMLMNNFITDLFFLYRCYVIWEFSKEPIILPVLLMLSTLVMGILYCAPRTGFRELRVPYILGAATNLVLTVSTAGRILWIRCEASHVTLDNTFRSRYNRAIGVILESGALYCLTVIFVLIGDSLNIEIFHIGYGIGQQLLNIIPTFTLVYIGLTKSGNNLRIESSRNVSSDQRKLVPLMQPNEPLSFPEVLHITKEGTEDTEVEDI